MNDRAYPFIREPMEMGGAADSIMVDIADPSMPVTLGGTRITTMPSGDVEVDFDGGGALEPQTGDANFYSNLAEYLDEGELDTIGSDVCEAVKVDLESRAEWLQRFQKGMELLGVVEASANLGVLKHAKEVNHPVIATALVQYQARAITEAFPPEGPVKTIIVGKKTPEREEQADRVSGYMNYQLLTEDRAYFPEADQGYFLVGLEGSIFKKVFHDHLVGRNVSRLVMARDFIVPYGASSLETALRYTHILPYTQNDVRKLQASGFYRDITLDLPSGEPADGHEAARQAQDRLEGAQPTDEIQDDRPHLVFEQYKDLDLPGFEDVDDFGQPTGVQLPYVVHVDRDSQKVLAIYRNWRQKDRLKRKRVRFAHFKYLPGPGFYGLGLVHMIGGLGAAATGILRLLLVTSAFAGAGGGFKSKEGAKIGSIELEPGVFKDVDATQEELSKSFYQPEFKQPPEVLFKVLGLLVEGAKEFSSSTEAMTGEAPSTGPVGTMVALIEQGSKVFSGIHKRSHMAAGEEFRMLAELNGEYLPDRTEGGYPYDVPGASREVFAEDFDERVDVVPVSDPNIFSATQRIAVAQSLLQLAKEFPGEISISEAVKRMVAALRTPDVESLLVRKQPRRADAVSENAMVMIGKPVRAYPDQDHNAHNAVHAGVMNDAKVPDAVKQAMAAHISEHMALDWMAQAAQAMGLPPLSLDLDAEPGQPIAVEMRPEVERALTQRAAAVINKLKPPQPSPELAQVQGDLALKKQRAQGELQIMAHTAAAKMKLQAAQAQFDQALARQVAFGKLALEREQGIAKMQQQGAMDQARMEQERLNTERTQVDAGVQQASGELEAAIKALAEGMDALAGMTEQALQANGGAPSADAG